MRPKSSLTPPHALRSARQSAFTLLELLVVVGILVIVSSSALLILDHEDDQQRYERVRDEYEEIHAAIFGPPLPPGASSVVSGFLADTGRLPRDLRELMERPADIPPWGPVLAPAASYHRLGGRLHHGWRGPYLGRTRANLEDAWGNPWIYEPPNPARGLPLRFGSLGRNGRPGGEDLYDASFPETLEIERGHYADEFAPVPSITVGYDREGKDTEFGPFALGIVHAGLDLGSRFAHRSGSRFVLHRSLLLDPERASAPDGGLYLIGPKGYEIKDRGKPQERKQFKEKEQEFIPQNLYLVAGDEAQGLVVRQYQLAAYRVPTPQQMAAGVTLRQLLVAINPEIFTI
jgi:prepilin-type N-terminal cleavage/methylation domain-containing protein